MVANLSIKQPWHTEYCHLKFSYSDLSADYATHYMLTPAKIYAVKTKTAPGKFQIKMSGLYFAIPDCAANVRKVIVEENIKLYLSAAGLFYMSVLRNYYAICGIQTPFL